MAWITKSRKQKELKEQEAAAKKLLSRIEESGEEVTEDSEDPVAFQQIMKKKKAKQQAIKKTHEDYRQDDVNDLILGHSLEDIKVAHEGILTLADKPILKPVKSDNYQIEESEDEIENIAVREKEKLKHYAELKAGKGKYNAYDMETEDDVLSKYNDDAQKPKKTTIAIKDGILQQDKASEIKKKKLKICKNDQYCIRIKQINSCF